MNPSIAAVAWQTGDHTRPEHNMTRAGFVEYVVGCTDLTNDDAERILDFYVRSKIARCDPSHGYQVKHGRYLDYDVLEIAAQKSLFR